MSAHDSILEMYYLGFWTGPLPKVEQTPPFTSLEMESEKTTRVNTTICARALLYSCRVTWPRLDPERT